MDRRSCNCRRVGSETPDAWTNFLPLPPPCRPNCGGQSRSATLRGSLTTCFDVLRRHGAALCIHDLLEDHPWIRTTDWVYARFHGPAALEKKYHGRYGPHRLEPAASMFSDWLADGHDVYAYFNNDYEGHAVADALWLMNRLERCQREILKHPM